jgi:hypothetical protein
MANDRSVGSSRSMSDHPDPCQYARYDVKDNPTTPGGTSGLCETVWIIQVTFEPRLTKRVIKKCEGGSFQVHRW